MTDPNGLTTTLTYDKLGRDLTKTVGTEKYTFTYDAAGDLTAIEKPDGSTVSNFYDPAHRLTNGLLTRAAMRMIVYESPPGRGTEFCAAS